MSDSENKKTSEELADETMDSVAGGTTGFSDPQTLTKEEIEELLTGQKVEGQKKR